MARASKVQLRLGERVVAEVAFEGAELRIGRMKENDLVINNLAVSRFHAVLRRVGNAFEIEDLGSENGTLVDGQMTSGSAVVPEGAAITIGKHTLQLVAGGEGTTQAPLPGKSDVWDAAQTYFVGGPPSASGSEEPVAEAVEAEREEEAVVDAVDAVDAIEESEPSDAVLEEEAPALVSLVESVAAEPELPVEPVAAEPEALVEPVAAEPEALAPEPVPELPLLEAVAETLLEEVAPEAPLAATGGEAAVAEAGPQVLELPDPDDALGFGEDELVGGAMPDPVAAEAPDAVVEAEEVPSPDVEPALEPGSPSGHDGLEAAGQTSLFDFGLSEDLGISDRSLERAATSGRVAVEPAPVAPASQSPAGEPAAETLHAGLIVERGGRVERVVAWDAASLLVGRAPECGLVLGGSGVSRRHAELTRDAGAHGVRDLGSANGVFVNGTQVEAATLTQGDVVRIDDYTLTFVLDREPIGESVQSDAAREAAAHSMPERDLVLAEDAELEAAEADKQLEASADAEVRVSAGAEPLVWAFEVAVATERLPEALRRALEEMDVAELVLPAQLRLVRRD
ncbi:MAG: FHA domain-containing protein [Myxococcota bacterium]